MREDTEAATLQVPQTSNRLPVLWCSPKLSINNEVPLCEYKNTEPNREADYSRYEAKSSVGLMELLTDWPLYGG